MPQIDTPLVGISGLMIASDDVDATREAWCRLAGAEHTPMLVVGGIAVGVGPTMGSAEGVSAVTLACEDVVETARLLSRRGLPTADDGVVDVGGLTWRLAGMSGPVEVSDAGDIEGVDHVVVGTSDPERAAALYGARLGLDLRLDRTMGQHRMRGLFFAVGGSVVEVVSRLDEEGQVVPTEGDAFHGVAWRVADLKATRERLTGVGVEVSDIREGRKPGTVVATVKDPDLKAATLLIGSA